MPTVFHILLVDDEEIALKRMESLMRKHHYRTTTVTDGAQALELVKAQRFDLLITDLVMDSIDGLELMAKTKKADPEIEVIIITGYASVDSAIEATKLGAFHYLQKPIRPDALINIVRQALEKRRLSRRVRELEQASQTDLSKIIGNSPKIIAVKNIIRQIEKSEANVLITGESGTGKELIANAIHRHSRRKNGPFQAFNCASFTEDLLANELFGHEKEAYTGATHTHPGLLESANGGTVFFDEVGDMSPAMQAKLLRVIEERELFRVGGSKPVTVDIRILSATNKDLKKLVEAGIFRQDLYFRLNVITIDLPTLSERVEDIPLLATYFLSRSSKNIGKEFRGYSEEAMGLLTQYNYPGNVRELENIIERAASLALGDRIEVGDLPADLRDFEMFTFHRERGKMKTLAEIEKDYIRWILSKTGHNKSETARILGIDRVTLHRKLKKLEFEE